MGTMEVDIALTRAHFQHMQLLEILHPRPSRGPLHRLRGLDRHLSPDTYVSALHTSTSTRPSGAPARLCPSLLLARVFVALDNGEERTEEPSTRSHARPGPVLFARPLFVVLMRMGLMLDTTRVQRVGLGDRISHRVG